MQLRHITRALVGVALIVVTLAAPLGAHAQEGFTPVGSIERFPQEAVDAFGPEFAVRNFDTDATSGTLLPVPDAGQLWQVFTSPAAASPRTGVLVRDARTTRVVSSFELPDRLERATIDLAGGEWLHAVDGGRRVFLVTVLRELLEVDTTTFAVRRLGVLTVLPQQLPANARGLDALLPAGLTFDPAGGKLLVAYGGPPANSVLNRTTVVQQIDPATGVHEAARVVRTCNGPLPGTDVGSDTYGLPLLTSSDAVHLPCHTVRTSLVAGDRPTGAVVRLPRASLWDADGEETAVHTSLYTDSALADPVGGRVSLLGVDGQVVVVDVHAMSVVGSFSAASGGQWDVGAGLDPVTGRLFFQSTHGLGYVDARSTPLAPPTVATSLAAAGQERIVSNGGRLFVLTGARWEKADRYSIYQVAR